jgi:hypothetical protein
MGEKIRDKIKAPSWVITLIAGMLITFLSFTIRTSARAQEMKSDIKNNHNEIERLDEEKASEDKVEMTYDIVLRIERKLDDHISKTTN